MDIIVQSKKKELETLQTEMSELQKDLSTLQNHIGFSELDGRLNKKLDKVEKSVINNKKGKMTRDRIDYENNNVYRCKEPQFFSGRSCKHQRKRVSFSDQETELANDTLATTASDSSPERPSTSAGSDRPNNGRNSGHPHGFNKKAKKKPTKGRGGEEEDTNTPKNNHYSLQGKTLR